MLGVSLHTPPYVKRMGLLYGMHPGEKNGEVNKQLTEGGSDPLEAAILMTGAHPTNSIH